MMTVKEVSRLTGVSVRTLQYYDQIGLLHPGTRTEAGYRLYDATTLETLQQILLFRELKFSLKEIAAILQNPHFDREKALEQQIELLTLQKRHLESLITLAENIRQTGGNAMDFTAFDTKKLDEYAAKAKQQWGATAAYQEYETKNAHETTQAQQENSRALMALVAAFGHIQTKDPADPAVQAQVQKLQAFSLNITTPAPKKFCTAWARCTVRAANLPRTSTQRAALARRSSPGKPSSDTAAGEFQTCPLYPAAICASINSRSQ